MVERFFGFAKLLKIGFCESIGEEVVDVFILDDFHLGFEFFPSE